MEARGVRTAAFVRLAAGVLVVFSLIGLGVRVVLAEQISARETGFAEFHAAFVVDQVLLPLLPPGISQGEIDAASSELLDELIVDRAMATDPMVSWVVLADGDGTVLYSPDPAAVGETMDVASPTSIVDVARHDLPPPLLRVPLRRAVGDRDVVFVVYEDHRPTVAAIRASQRSLDRALILGLAAIYLLSLPLVRRLTSTLRDQATRLQALLDREHETVERLRELDATKDLILAAVSHQLRTPMAVLTGLTETLRTHWDALSEDQRREMVARVDDNTGRLSTLLRDLMDIDRLARGVLAPSRRPTDLEALVRQEVEHVDLEDRQVVIAIEDRAVDVDPTMVERIVESLLVNVARHTPPDTRVVITTERDAEHGIVLAVADDGPGIPDAEQRRLFEPFTHGTAAAKHSPGAGIGLTLVARFAELHGGEAWIEDRPGGGTLVKVSFGVASTDASDVLQTA